MKVYVKATNVSDLQAKIAKKQADIDKKKAWIQKREESITKRLNLLNGKISDEDYELLVGYLELLRNNNKYRLSDDQEVSTWRMIDKYGFDYDDKYGKALYGVTGDAESIYNSKEAITEMQRVLDSYEEKLEAIKAKGEEIDRIPECLKEFMNDIVSRWDKHDLRIKYEGKPYYKELRQKAWEILYGNTSTGNPSVAKAKLEELYPDVDNRGYIDARRKKFDYDYITHPFELKFGSIKQANAVWDLSDEKIHAINLRDGETLILDLLKRVTKITGPVTDWSSLYVTQGNGGAVINGLVYGEDGTAHVDSILAGGYNIQRLHVRTLVKPVKR